MSAEQIETTPTTSAPDMVAIHEASDDELLDFLVNDPSLVEEDGAPQQQDEPVETDTQEHKGRKEEEAKPAKEETITRAEYEKLKADHEKALKIAEDGKRFIGRQSHEIGQLRKQLEAEIAAKNVGLEDKWLTDPKSAVADTLEIKKKEEAIQNLTAQEQNLQKIHYTQEIVSKFVKPDETSMPDMVAILKQDGVAEEFVEAYQQNPFAVASPAEIIHLAKRAAMRKDMIDLIGYAKSLEAKLKEKPTEVIQKINGALNSSKSMNGSAATTGGTTRSKNQDVSTWTQAEIEAFLEKSKG